MSRQSTTQNIIGADLVRCFSPIHNVLLFLGCSRISLREELVTTPSVGQKLYTIICIAAVTFSFYYFNVYYYITFYNENITLYMACVIGTLVQQTSYLFNTINARFCDGEASVNLWLNLQKVDSILTLKELKHFKKQQYYWNIVCLVVVIAIFECGFITYINFSVENPILTVFIGMGLLNVYVELVLAASLIFYLVVRLRFLNKVVKYNFHVKCYYDDDPPNPKIVNQSLIISTESSRGSNNLDLQKFLLCLKELLKMYKLITESFSFTVMNTTATLFLWSILVTLTMIIGLRTKLLSIVVIITTGCWLLYYILLLTMLAVVSDYFIQEVKETKLLSILAMSRRLEGPIRKGANDIFRTIEYYQPVFSVYGIFTLDKKFPLSLIGLITTNLVALIQFTIKT